MTSAEAIVVVLDVGANVSQEKVSNGETFLENAKLCATKIIQRKIFSKTKDEIGLIFVGSEQTNNQLADGEGYKHIEIAHQLKLANWKMVKSIAQYQKGTAKSGDWLDALIVAADYLKTATEGKRFKEKKIVMLTNFCSDVSDDEVDCIIQGLKEEMVQIIAIGPHIYSTESQGSFDQGMKSQEQEEGEKLISRIVPNSVICSFEDAIPQLAYFEIKKTRPTAWKAEMTIGSTIKIPVKCFLKIAATKPIPTHDIIIPAEFKNPSSVSSAPVLSSSQSSENYGQNSNINLDKEEESDDGKQFTLIEKDRIYQVSGNDAEAVDAADVIEGYMFGTTIVPVTDDDRPKLAFSSGEKCLSVLGFTKMKNVPFYLFSGEGCHEVYPEDDEGSKQAFSALIQAMDSNEMVGIVRKVHRKDSAPTVNALFPMISPKYQCLVMIQLPFAENVHTLVFPPLVTEKNKPTDEQLKVVDELISKMNLMDDEDDLENGAYDPHKTLDPYMQHYQSIVAKKALKGDSYISRSETDEAVKHLLSPKEELIEASLPAITKIKSLFPLQKVTPKEGARKAAVDLFQQYGSDSSTKPTDKQPVDVKDIKIDIGTVKPEEDFKALINQGISLESACKALFKVISDLILQAFDSDDFLKPSKCLLEMRKACLKENPMIYNDYIIHFKKDLPMEKKDFWQLVVRNDAGLITSSENDLSIVNREEAKLFLEFETGEEEVLTSKTTVNDFEDLLHQF
ncbi:X-ray repair cross-complementing protein 5 [Frankliniella fusca]|uniref:X-ray repair cross-complementing protein 5 n=1 Tax=Frankliniella fusca TaxID=407009 RepID=A0AAE1HGQ4_9NEOP|nr:X-ray repair cross-complementing protein 5 [Frankliniella fusca]